ncbi:MAG: hypothetical protein Q9164_002225 [Protoblastenia rupestris]
MSTAKRRRGHSLRLDLPDAQKEDLPPIVAAFLVRFDVKAGYKITWKRSITGLSLNDSVEFKSLPSGLHTVQEDLIYFNHNDNYAGVSAFRNRPSTDYARNALMLAVGALLPSRGLLGKSWEHAEGLKDLADILSKDPEDTQPLEDFWTAHQLQDPGSQEEGPALDSPSEVKARRKPPQPSPNGHVRKRNRAVSTTSALALAGHSLSLHHPVRALPTFLETFGPLIFPLYKAALLRKRILLMGHAPVELACHFVHVPPPHSKQAKQKVWPRMQNTKSSDIKATQRDLRRYRALRQELRHFTDSHSPHTTPGDLPRPLSQDNYDTDTSSMLDADLAEPQSIPALLYNSFMFWASAGEQRTDLDEEAEHDAALLRQIDLYEDASPNRPRSARKSPGISPGMEEGLDENPAKFDITLVAYFHRFTTLILKTLADIIDDADAESASDNGSDSETARLNSNEQSEEEEVPRRKIVVQSEDMTRIGLDSWSESDRIFVQDLIAFYWGREAEVRGGRIECCGVRVC